LFGVDLVLYSSQRGWWKIADFGLTSDGVTSRLRTTILGRGTLGYRAPELLREELGYSKKTDIWSLGCIIYELCTRKPAFSNDFNIREFRSPTDLTIEFLDGMSQEFRDTITSTWLTKMLQREHDNRPSIKFFADNFGAVVASVIPAVVTPTGDSWMSSHNVIGTEGPVKSGILNWADVFVPGTHEQQKATVSRCERVRNTRQRFLGTAHRYSYWSTVRLAWVYLGFLAFKEAKALFEYIIKIQQQKIDRFHADTIACKHALAICFVESEMRKEAYKLYQEVLDLQRQHRVDEKETMKTVLEMARLESVWGDARVSAQETTANILSRRLAILGEGHPDTLYSMNVMAWSYWWSKDFENASSWFSRAITIGRRSSGNAHPMTVDSIVGLAWSNHDRGRPKPLELLEAMEAARRIWGEEYVSTAETRARLVEVFHRI
jgi:hypothetical protein